MERIKLLLICCIILFSIFIPSIQGVTYLNSLTYKSDIIRVDNEGDGDYTSIKVALNNANPGDTIEVYSGTYYGNYIEVKKDGIIFQGIPYELGNGSDIGKPFIDGNQKGNIFILYNKSITIDNFHIENIGDTTADDMIAIAKDATNCIISNNELHYASGNIIFSQGPKCSIINNNISHSSIMNGIDFYKSSNNNIVYGNNISYVKDGIFLGDSYYTITGNKITNCSRYGVDFATGDHSVLEGNHIEGNNIGIEIYGSDINVKNNNFLNNKNNILYITEIGWIINMFTSVRFEGNHYDDWRGFGPKLIWGLIWLIPISLILNIDWHPAKEPYKI